MTPQQKDRMEQLIGKWKHAQAGAVYASWDMTDEKVRELIDLLLAEREGREQIIAKLPRTVDGAPIYVGMHFWRSEDADDPDFEGWQITRIGRGEEHYGTKPTRLTWITTNGIGEITTQCIYSSREAAASALAAGEKEKES